MSVQPPPVPSSRWWGLFGVLRPVLLCAALFWVGPEGYLIALQLLEHPPAY